MNLRTIAAAGLAVAALTACSAHDTTASPAETPVHVSSHFTVGHKLHRATPPPMPASLDRPCQQEDSVNCYWNASQQGNGVGHSFYVRRFPGRAHMVCVLYVLPRDASRWDYCEALRSFSPRVTR